jgi:hypothetical protein
MLNFHSKQRAVRQVATYDGPLLTHQSRLSNQGACWNTSTVEYLRASALDSEMSDMHYPTLGFRTFLRMREVKL